MRPRKTTSQRGRLLAGTVLVFSLALRVFAQTPDDGSSAGDDSTGSATELLQRIDRYEQRVAELQRRNGPYDLSVTEPMQALADAHLEAGNLREAAAALEERLQVHRTTQGLYSRQQIPILRSLLDIRARQGEWREVNDTLAGLRWLYERNEEMPVDERLSGLRELGQWQIRLMARARPERQAEHLLERRRLREQAVDLVEQNGGPDYAGYEQVSYERALAELEIALAIFTDADTAAELLNRTEGLHDGSRGSTLAAGNITTPGDVEAVYGSRATSATSRSFRRHMRNHFDNISDLRDHFQERDEAEAEAMALLYMGDSVLIRQQYERTPETLAGPERGSGATGTAVDYYRQAWELFRETGFEADTLESRLGCPVRLPLSEFHREFAALPECRQSEAGNPRLTEFHALSETVPSVSADSRTTRDGPVVRLRFEIGVNGQASRPEFLEAEPDSTSTKVRADDLLQDVQFRPALEDGRPRATDRAVMRMHLPPER